MAEEGVEMQAVQEIPATPAPECASQPAGEAAPEGSAPYVAKSDAEAPSTPDSDTTTVLPTVYTTNADSSPDSAEKAPPFKRGATSIDHNFTVSEVEAANACCGPNIKAGFNQESLKACPSDVVKFSWLKKGRSLKIESKSLDAPIEFEDKGNDRCFNHHFDRTGKYKVTCYDDTVKFHCTVHIETSARHLQVSIAKNVLIFGIFSGVLIGGSAFITELLFSAAGFVPDKDYDEGKHNEKASDKLAEVMKSHASVPIILGSMILVLGPVMALTSCLRPEPLTSYGRGFEYQVHTKVRGVMGLFSLICFGIVLWGWDSYGLNGNAIENMMAEVGFIAIFVGEQLGAAAGSLGSAITATEKINSDYSVAFTKNSDCPYTTSSCYELRDNWSGQLSKDPRYLNTWYPYRYGGAPSLLMGDPLKCPDTSNAPCDFTNPNVLDDKGCVFCVLQLQIFYQMSHALAGYEEEGLIFSSNDEMKEMLSTANVESKNAESYGNLGEQMIASIMRIRMVLVYFMMQVALISAACCAAGSWRSKQKLIKSGGWCALIALCIALFSYSINKPIAVIVEESVNAMVAANDDLGSAGGNSTDMPLMQILAYCKSSDEDSGDDSSNSFDLKFAADLAAMINPNATATSSSPAAVKDSIKLASATIFGLQTYFLSSPQLTEALGNGVEMLPIVNGLFAAVSNIISIIDCEVAYQVFERILVILQDEAVGSFNAIADAEISLCVILAVIFFTSRFTAYVLDRPRKLWYCAETNRWFRFKAAYNAHVSLLKKKKASMISNMMSQFTKSVTPSFSCINIAIEIAMSFHIFLFMLIPNAMMAMSGNGFNGVKDYVPAVLLATALIGLFSTWASTKGKCSASGATFAVILAFFAAATCVLGAAENLRDTLDCLEIMDNAMTEVQVLRDECERVGDDVCEDASYAAALTAAQDGAGGIQCDFGSISEYAQGMIFSLVCFLLCLMAFITGIAYLCARSHLVTDKVRKTMLKASKNSTAAGKQDALIESLGGKRTDGLNSDLQGEIIVKFKRWKTQLWFQLLVGGGVLGASVGAGFAFKAAQDLIAVDKVEWKFNQCGAGTKCCNGLESNCDKPLNEITFAGVHNSMSNAQDGWLSPNNFLPHIGALNLGYRGLMIDTFLFDGDFDSSTPETLYACHGLCAFGKRTAFDEFNHTKVWLDNNPDDLVVLFMENYGGNDASNAMHDVFETLELNDKLVERNADGTWPTMGECLENGKQIVMLKQTPDCIPGVDTKCPMGYMPMFPAFTSTANEDALGGTYDTPYSINDKTDFYKDVENKIFDDTILDGLEGRDQRGLEDPKNLFSANHFITSPVASPTFAHAINWDPFVSERIQGLEEAKGRRLNFVWIDFWSIGDVVQACQENNKLPIPTL